MEPSKSEKRTLLAYRLTAYLQWKSRLLKNEVRLEMYKHPSMQNQMAHIGAEAIEAFCSSIHQRIEQTAWKAGLLENVVPYRTYRKEKQKSR